MEAAVVKYPKDTLLLKSQMEEPRVNGFCFHIPRVALVPHLEPPPSQHNSRLRPVPVSTTRQDMCQDLCHQIYGANDTIL